MLILNLSYRVKEHIKHICLQTAIIYLIIGIRNIVKVLFIFNTTVGPSIHLII